MRKLFLIIMTLVACSWAAMAQTTYRGTVVDAENNEPLVGATIMPIGGGQGAATDIDGKYSISVPSNVRQAKVTYVGYKEQVVNLTNNMTIKLVSTEQNLDDLVVVAYGTSTKESLTGSVAVVGSKEIEDRPVTSVTAALEGNAPGVQVNNSVGYPGSSPSILIRGYNTINGATSSPLIVVDGIVYSGSISDLNPADVESMSVLKDAASAALYGNRGANGVILITTKKAKQAGKVEVTLEMRQGMYNRGLPFYDRMGTNQWMQTQFDALVNGRVSQVGGTRQSAIDQYREQFFTLANSNVYGVPSNELFNEDGKFVGGNPLPGYTDLDWWDAVSRSGHRQEYTVNAAAATDKFNIFASAGYLKENGYMLQTDFERFNGRMNANFQPVSYFKMGVNIAAMQTNSDLGITSKSDEGLVSNPFAVMDIAPNIPYYQHDLETGAILYDELGSPLWNDAQYLGNQGTNVAYSMRLDKKKSDSTVVDASIYGTAVIPYGFELTVRGNIHRDKTNSWSYMNNINGSAVQSNGRLYQTFGTYNDHTFMQTLTWNQQYGDHNVDVLLNHENYQSTTNSSSVNAEDQLLPGLYNLSNFATTNPASQTIVQIRSESYLGRVRYNYDQKYFGEFSVRSDGSSYFEKDHRWGTFWSVGGSWIITKEKFMDSTRNWLDYLKLRAAYGAVGNDANAGAYAYYNLYDMINYGGNLSTLIPITVASQNLKWEATRTFDVALEGSMFNDRFTFSVGYFNKRNTDLIFNVQQPSSAGSTSDTGFPIKIMRNIGTMQNIGWELSFGVDIIRNADFRWNFNVDATIYKNKIIKLPNGHDLPGQGLFIGKSLGTLYMNEWVGVDMTTGKSVYELDPNSPMFTQWSESGVPSQNTSQSDTYISNAALADALIAVPNGDGYKLYTTNIAYATSKIQKDAFPTMYGSFGTNLSWKGINLGMLFTYSLGGYVNDTNYMDLMSVSSEPRAIHKDAANSWTEKPAGYEDHVQQEITVNGKTYTAYIASMSDFDKNAIPQLNSNEVTNNNGNSSRWITNGGYLVFKNLNVSYDLPRAWVNAMRLQNINIGMSIDNLFTVTNRKGMNPQYSFGGGQGKFYVPARVFAFSLNVKF